jgi:hypothetical protein
LVKKGLNDTHFDVVLDHLKSTLVQIDVPGELIDEVIAIAEGTRGDILAGPDKEEVISEKEAMAKADEFLDSMRVFWEGTEDTAVKEEIVARDNLGRLKTCSMEEMVLFFRHYRLFTQRHIDDLAVVISRLPFSELKAFFTKVLYEEFGMETSEGYPNNHLALLDAFLVSLGAEKEYCGDPAVELPSNLDLLHVITEKLTTESLHYAVGLRGMGAECLCQVYLTVIFELSNQNPQFIDRKDSLDLRFWEVHTGPVEIEHRIQMRKWIAELVMHKPEGLAQMKAGYEHARKSFHDFFVNIYRHIDASQG